MCMAFSFARQLSSYETMDIVDICSVPQDRVIFTSTERYVVKNLPVLLINK
jgi:hypothetical protein